MAQNFPFGECQTLQSANVTLELTECHFLSTEELVGGYARRRLDEHVVSVDYNLLGEPVLRQPFFEPRYSFEWNLYLG